MPIKTETIQSYGCGQADSTAAKSAHGVIRVGQKCVFFDKDITETDNVNATTGLVEGMNLTYSSSENCPTDNSKHYKIEVKATCNNELAAG